MYCAIKCNAIVEFLNLNTALISARETDSFTFSILRIVSVLCKQSNARYDNKPYYNHITVINLFQNYYEELVSVRDSQITKLQKDLDKVTRENEEHRKEMDRIVIELQQNM